VRLIRDQRSGKSKGYVLTLLIDTVVMSLS
jgi:hypothetical protein